MAGNSTLRTANPRNLIVSILDGLAEQKFGGLESMPPMPSFAQRFSDGEIADLSHYLRATWGDSWPTSRCRRWLCCDGIDAVREGKMKKGRTCVRPFWYLAPRPGLEPGTCGLTVRRSTD